MQFKQMTSRVLMRSAVMNPAAISAAVRRVATGLAVAVLFSAGLGSPGLQPASAAEIKTYVIEFKDGVMTPMRLEVAAGTRFKIVLRNIGSTPAEFESVRMRKEKVLAPGVESFIVIRRLSPGSYDYFDEFHTSAGRGVIVAR